METQGFLERNLGEKSTITMINEFGPALIDSNCSHAASLCVSATLLRPTQEYGNHKDGPSKGVPSSRNDHFRS